MKVVYTPPKWLVDPTYVWEVSEKNETLFQRLNIAIDDSWLLDWPVSTRKEKNHVQIIHL